MSDLIDREQAMNIFAVDLAEKDRQVSYQGFCIDAVMAIGALPSAEKTGRWAWPSAGKMGRWLESRESSLRPFMCSNCGCIYDVDTSMGKPIWNYCPNCGARMVD